MADDDARIGASVRSRASHVKTLVAQRKSEDAVRAALEDPPVLAKSDAIKDENAQTVLTALLACNKGEMQRVVDSLSTEQEDALMKYVSRFLALASQSAVVLEWHQKLATKAGAGCIMRAFTDRKQTLGIVVTHMTISWTPVIAVNSGGPLESIVDGETGFLCESTPEAFGDAMATLCGKASAERVATMGAAGKARARSHFSLETFVHDGLPLRRSCVAQHLTRHTSAARR